MNIQRSITRAEIISNLPVACDGPYISTEWMAAPVNRDTHLFDSALACCQTWYSDQVSDCEANVIATNNGNAVDGDFESGEWYPTQAWPFDCVNDGNVPTWMTLPGYRKTYVFSGKAECCKAHYCSSLQILRVRSDNLRRASKPPRD